VRQSGHSAADQVAACWSLILLDSFIYTLNAIVAQSKNRLFGVNTTIELKNIETASHKNGI